VGGVTTATAAGVSVKAAGGVVAQSGVGGGVVSVAAWRRIHVMK